MKKLLVLLVLGFTLTAQAQSTVSMFEFIRLNEGFSTLTAALQETGLDAVLQGPGEFTLFAPTDAAFAALPAAERDALFGDLDALKAFLNGLIVPEKVAAGGLLERGRATTQAGTSLSFSQSGDGTVLVGDAPVVGTDLGAGGIKISNGVVQVLDTLPSALR